MLDNDSKGISYTAGFFMLIAFAIGGLILAFKLGDVISFQMAGKSFEEIRQSGNDPANSNVIKITQCLMTVFGFLIPSIVTAFLLNRDAFKLLGFSMDNIRLSQIGLAILLIGCSLLVATSLSNLTNNLPLPDSWRTSFDKLEDEYNRQASAVLSLKNVKDYILALIIMAFLPALCEESFFRGGLQNFLTRSTGMPWLSIVIVSIIFSLVHFSGYGFLSRFFLGAVLGAIFHYSGKLWLSILAHFMNNALAVTVFYISTQQGKPLQEAMKQDATSFWGILAIPVVIGLFIAFKKTSAHRRIV